MDTVSFHYWIAPEDIALAQALLAGFEGLACLRVDRRDTGEVTFWAAPQQLEDFRVFLADLVDWVRIHPRVAAAS
jgi:hypothetical protein